MDPEAAAVITPHLLAREELLWCGRPHDTTALRWRAGVIILVGIAALVLRSGEPGRTFIPLKPMVLAVGGKARNFVRVEILDGTTVVATLPLAGGRAAWPAGTKPLVGYRKYTLRFVAANGAPVSFAVSSNSRVSSRIAIKAVR